MTMPTNASDFVQRMRILGNNLIEALNQGDSAQIVTAQQEFSGAIEHAWQYFNRPEVPAREKAIPRLIEGWAQRDLTAEISEPANHKKAIHDLKLFMNTLALFE